MKKEYDIKTKEELVSIFLRDCSTTNTYMKDDTELSKIIESIRIGQLG